VRELRGAPELRRRALDRAEQALAELSRAEREVVALRIVLELDADGRACAGDQSERVLDAVEPRARSWKGW
jgi:DNA-directed RNA polymerase specialized sigma24 family protein